MEQQCNDIGMKIFVSLTTTNGRGIKTESSFKYDFFTTHQVICELYSVENYDG